MYFHISFQPILLHTQPLITIHCYYYYREVEFAYMQERPDDGESMYFVCIHL